MPRRLDRFREGGILDDGVEQTVQAHGGLFPSGWAVGQVGNTKGPTRGAPGGIQRTTGGVRAAGAVDNGRIVDNRGTRAADGNRGTRDAGGNHGTRDADGTPWRP
ncbi:hypothetical protein GCM10010389_42970 [Streptomyces echinoruber]|uniref:Uncharacterized protein n=1 Tax=Streptomyces echinoruber TaxID=68898 RepID=A0A918RII2_9ACTN|nr:hypothetical protein GCM10010389_42970 [Streptomyces echinoruber]